MIFDNFIGNNKVCYLSIKYLSKLQINDFSDIWVISNNIKLLRKQLFFVSVWSICTSTFQTWILSIHHRLVWFGWFMVLNSTFNNISVISWRSALFKLLMDETKVPRENHRHVASHRQTLSHIHYIEYTSPWMGFALTTLVVIGTDCTGSCKSNCQTITTMIAPT